MKRLVIFAFAVAIGLLATEAFAQKPDAPQQEGRAVQEARPGQRQAGQRPGGREQGGTQTRATKPVAVAITKGVATISPENSKVEFVGTHVGPDPKPRLGGFKKFNGELAVSEDGSSIKSLTLDFDTTSLWTEIGDKLTTHLKNADFLDVEKYPTAEFVSKSIKTGEKEGTIEVVGDFTLMGKTNEITIPVKMTNEESGVLVKAVLSLDRASFGMNKMADRVSNEVSITLSIGEKTSGEGAGGRGQSGRGQSGRGQGGRGQGGRGQGGRGQGGRGGFDPSAMFKNQDANGDGKLSGDEIPERMRERVESIDTDGDKAITLEEMQKAMQGRGGGNRGGRGEGEGGRQGGRPSSDGEK